ncbi:MFS domain-containing protein [Mycena chlorophos]|uniref:MFS domain-containing protein n=1 Tax=Mycena chlorophos TaxID=658473 RepID=A0A8H6TMD6_MYCCL|nr:MFS domain-containing protein [Mycena chlorophos]
MTSPSRSPSEATASPEAAPRKESPAGRWRKKLTGKPAAWWLMIYAPFSMILQTSTAGASLELYNMIICARIHPAPQSGQFSFPGTDTMAYGGFAQGEYCAGDPLVLKEQAKLATTISTVTGILTFLTAAWWGSFSDRHGRTRMLGLSAIGHTLVLANVIMVAQLVDKIPGDTDISTAETRSRVFAVVAGSMLIGVGIGPIVGSLILRLSHDTLAVFYFALVLRVVHTLFIWLILPESRTEVQMHEASARYRESLDATASGVKYIVMLFKPLEIFWPKHHVDPHTGREKREWNLFSLALADGVMLLAASSLITQFLYALGRFGWDGEYLGYCISSIGFARAIYLALILPSLINARRDRRTRAFARQHLNKRAADAAEVDAADTILEAEPDVPLPTPTPVPPHQHSSHFDLSLARFSILIHLITFTLLPLAPTSILFIVVISFDSFAAGLAPAINSVALDLYTHQVGLEGVSPAAVEPGKLYGAMTVVQALFGSIMGPPLYGFIYAKTVATEPRTIFFVAFANAAIALAVLGFVRLPRRRPVPSA